MTFTPAQIAAADRTRPLVARSVAASATRIRTIVDTMAPEKLPAPRSDMLAAADKAEALIQTASPSVILDLYDVARPMQISLTETQAHIPFIPLILALAGAPRSDAVAINKIVAGL